ncbi:hypothetical protein FJT64_024989 [Amphibalanus amphitrite]|uniref:Uncharacterized protein n=1 Tax=Amphibalanus amphitrite TaxID=1232801 RepID=A0A6A4WM69_AMPAM|nr:hypothetical protein FJT64_024989 [Amphibalanus amphitrite]
MKTFDFPYQSLSIHIPPPSLPAPSFVSPDLARLVRCLTRPPPSAGLSSPVKPPSHLLPPHKVSPRNTATVPPLPQSLAPVTSVGQPPVSAASSQANSFAAALKSLARNAGGTETKEPAAPSKSSRDSAPPMSPKRGPLHVPRAPHTDNPPPVVAIAPTPTHQRSRESAPITSSAADLKGSLPAEVSSHLTAACRRGPAARAGRLPAVPGRRAAEAPRGALSGLCLLGAAAAAAAAAGGLYSPAADTARLPTGAAPTRGAVPGVALPPPAPASALTLWVST